MCISPQNIDKVYCGYYVHTRNVQLPMYIYNTFQKRSMFHMCVSIYIYIYILITAQKMAVRNVLINIPLNTVNP